MISPKKYLLLFSLLFILNSGCRPLENVEMEEEYGYTVKFKRNKKNHLKEGKFVRYNADKVIVEEANYLADTLHGQRTLYTPEGNMEIIENYEKGVFHGPYKEFYPDGSILQEGAYVDGTMEGNWQSYYTNGQLKEVVMFENNNENGPFIEYHENGKLKAKGSYLEGDSEHGELLLYDTLGTLVKKMDCNRGICHTTWTKE